MSDARQPNIVFAFADDWGRYASVYADIAPANSPSARFSQLIDTPNVDRVAREGAVFTNALVPAPSCTPCRSSLLSGRYFWQTGQAAILQGARWDESIPTYPLMLEDNGYHIGFTYKCWSPGEPRDAGYGGDRTRYAPAGNKYAAFSQTATSLLDKLSVDDAKKVLLDETRENFQAFLDARQGDTPFAYWWGPTNTHREWQQGSGKQLWNIDPDQLKGKLPDFLPDVHEVREDIADYLGECMAVDAGVGVLLEMLEAMGELDNTLFVISGDHGIPGFPRGKCNLYDHGCEVALMARWPGQIKPGRQIDDMVNLMDLAPTFLEAAGVEPHPTMTAKSLLPVLTAEGSGQIDPQRDAIVVGRERHVAAARQGHLPYPQRAIRTHDWLYIRNFEPDRWPMGDPKGLDDPTTPAPDYDTLCHDTFICYGDLDASPTKAWMIHHRAEDEVWPKYQLGFGKFPAQELYHIPSDPHHMQNLVDDPEHQAMRKQLADRLMKVLGAQQDPRVAESPCRFEAPPFAGPV